MTKGNMKEKEEEKETGRDGKRQEEEECGVAVNGGEEREGTRTGKKTSDRAVGDI